MVSLADDDLGPGNFPLRISFTRKSTTKAERRGQQIAQRRAKEDARVLLQIATACSTACSSLLNGEPRFEERTCATEAAEPDVDEEDVSDEEIDFLNSIRRWMHEDGRDSTAANLMQDFKLEVMRWGQGALGFLGSDQLEVVIRVIAEDICAAVDLRLQRLQPKTVAEAAEPFVNRWVALLDYIWELIGDSTVASNVAVRTVRVGVAAACGAAIGVAAGNQASIEVGIIMAIRDCVEGADTADVLAGCRCLQPKTIVLDKFISFLQGELDASSEDESPSSTR